VQPLPVQTGRRRAARVEEELRRLPRQCQATTQAGRPCKNRIQLTSRFCRVHAPWSPQARSRVPYTPQAHLANQVLEGRLARGLVTLPQLAVYRVAVLMGLGLMTWLLSLLLMRLGEGTLSLSLPLWGWSLGWRWWVPVDSWGVWGHGWGWGRVFRWCCFS
jgi:hypothetical protein